MISDTLPDGTPIPPKVQEYMCAVRDNLNRIEDGSNYALCVYHTMTSDDIVFYIRYVLPHMMWESQYPR
jgi:hypothetical protein